jgi:hypothetical protein
MQNQLIAVAVLSLMLAAGLNYHYYSSSETQDQPVNAGLPYKKSKETKNSTGHFV